MLKKLIVTAVVGLSITSIVHVGTPYIALYQAKSTIDSGDEASIKMMLKEHVDFNEVRSDIKSILTEASAIILNDLDKDLTGNPFKGFARGIATLMIPAFVENLLNEVTPDRIATMIVKRDQNKITNCKVELIGFGKAQYNCFDNSGKQQVSLLAQSIGFTWKVTGISVTNKEEFFKSLKK
jgi:hypothetical protein